MDTLIFKYGELPEFKKFTPENIRKQFPDVLEKIGKDFINIEKNLSNYLVQNDLNWDKVINPLNEVNEILRWSWGVISHLNAVNNSKSLRDIYSKFLPEVISISNKFGQSKIIYNTLVIGFWPKIAINLYESSTNALSQQLTLAKLIGLIPSLFN